MTAVETLIKRNEHFAAHEFKGGSTLMPSLKTMIIGCVDPRVDPAHVLGLELGDAVVIRNVGGRITPATLQAMALLGMIGRAEGASAGSGWNIIVLHHTDCGITRLVGSPTLLADHFGVSEDQLASKAVSDPRQAVAIDLEALKATLFLPGEFTVSGFVYDVDTGLLDCVAEPALLRDEK